MNGQFEFSTYDPKTVQLYFSTFHMSQLLLKSWIIQDENFARLLVFSCFALVIKIVSSEQFSKLTEIAKKNEINVEAVFKLENYILNLVDWRLHITTPHEFASDLINLLLSKDCQEDRRRKMSIKFNKVFQIVIANFEIYKCYNQFIWTVVILQHSLVIQDMAEESEILNEIIASLISSEQESDDLASCFDDLTFFLEKFEQNECLIEMDELNLRHDENSLVCNEADEFAKLGRNSRTLLNIDLLANFNSLSNKVSMQVNGEYLNTSNYNTVTKASEMDNYDSTGSLTTISLNLNPCNQLDMLANLELTAKTWNYSHIDLDTNDCSDNEFVIPTILNAMKRRCSLKAMNKGNLG